MPTEIITTQDEVGPFFIRQYTSYASRVFETLPEGKPLKISGLPAGLSYEVSGRWTQINGYASPGQEGVYPITVSGQNASDQVTPKTYELRVFNTPKPAILDDIYGSFYVGEYAVASIGSSSPEGSFYYPLVVEGSIPGLDWESPTEPGTSGGGSYWQGTPTEAGTYEFTVSGRYPEDQVEPRTYTLTINPPRPPVIDNAFIDPIFIDMGYYYGMVRATGDATITIEGDLPEGIYNYGDMLSAYDLNPDWVGQSWPLIVTAENPNGKDVRHFTLYAYSSQDDLDGVAITDPEQLPDAYVGQPWSYTFTLIGVPPHGLYTYEELMPDWLKLDRDTQTVSGTPTEEGVWDFPIQITSYNMSGGTRFFVRSIELVAPTFVAPAEGPLAQAHEGDAYEVLFVASGTAPISYSATGDLPTGLSLDENGRLSGTIAVKSGSFSFQVTAENAQGTATRNYSIEVVDTPEQTDDGSEWWAIYGPALLH